MSNGQIGAIIYTDINFGPSNPGYIGNTKTAFRAYSTKNSMRLPMHILGKLAVLTFVLSSQTVFAAELGDPVRGLAYAKDVCSECHAVQAGQNVSPNIKAPPFEIVARSKLVTQREILAWLQSSHTDMPDLSVPPDKRDDVTAYIMSLGE